MHATRGRGYIALTHSYSGTARSEYLGVRRRCKGRVHPGAGYPEGLPRDSGRGMPWATTGQDEVSVREAPTASVFTRSRPAESHRNRRQLCWQCGGTCHLRRESHGGRNQGAENTNSITRGCTGMKGGSSWPATEWKLARSVWSSLLGPAASCSEDDYQGNLTCDNMKNLVNENLILCDFMGSSFPWVRSCTDMAKCLCLQLHCGFFCMPSPSLIYNCQNCVNVQHAKHGLWFGVSVTK
jgi:hypothetical protein